MVRRNTRLRAASEADPIARFTAEIDSVPLEEQMSTDMHRLFYGNTGALVHKWRHYLSVYDRHLSQYRGTQVRLLEIGVSRGGSLSLWRQYFGSHAKIFGIDVDPRCKSFDGRDAAVRIGSQADVSFLSSVVKELGGIDVVIDDGSHVFLDQLGSLRFLFPLLSPDGVYLCEDTHTSYWGAGYRGGVGESESFIGLTKRLIDDLHADFHSHSEALPLANRTINSIHIYNSIVVIEKKVTPRPSHVRTGFAEF